MYIPFNHTAVSRLALALVFTVPAMRAHADVVDPESLFIEMNKAAGSLNYQGIFVYGHSNKVDTKTIKVVHIRDKGAEFEQYTLLNGENRTITRKNDQVYCPFPGGKGLRLHRLRFSSGDPRETIATMKKHYRFEMAKHDRVAGRECNVVSIVPNDNLRYGYKLWIDKQSKMLMRTDVVDSGKIVEQMMFAELKFINNPAEIPRPKHRKVKRRASIQKPGPQKPKWHMDLPPGFFLAEQKLVHENHQSLEHMIYTDGIASVSVFLEIQHPKLNSPPEHNPFIKDAISLGAINAVAIPQDQLRRNITVVGEVPALTVQKIAASIKQVDP